MSAPVRVAVVGTGAFGRNHLRVLREMPQAALVGVLDKDRERGHRVAAEFGTEAVESLAELVGRADAAVVAVPTSAHCDVACQLLELGLDVLVEKPIAPTLEEADTMITLAEERGRILQVGHLERFNPAVQALAKHVTTPLFFEIHRLSIFTPRSLDVDVVLDLMIHDIDILLALVQAEPEEVRAAGISILSGKVDIANVRLAFPGGCVANLTASRVSTETVRKLRLFQPNRYLSVDYPKQELMAIGVGPERQMQFLPVAVAKQEPLRAELEHFVHCVATRSKPLVDGAAARGALSVCQQILAHIQAHAAIVADTLEKQQAAAGKSPATERPATES